MENSLEWETRLKAKRSVKQLQKFNSQMIMAKIKLVTVGKERSRDSRDIKELNVSGVDETRGKEE
jgi:hypothetical protein